MERIILFGTYESREQLETAIDIAKRAGFRNTDLSVLVPDSVGSSEPEDQQPGAGSTARLGPGVVITGGGLGSLVGAGTLMVPGIGPTLAAGPILTALSKAQAERVVPDVMSLLIGVGVPAGQAKRYQGFLQRGRILASLHADNAPWAARAKQVLEGTGAKNISEVDGAKSTFTQEARQTLSKAV